jgi:membrane protein YqaA with SNARE-associated domain
MNTAASIPWYRQPFAWIRRLYDWTLSWADSKYGTHALAVLAFCESSFFPIPPDVLLMALALSKPKRALWYAFVCTAGSVAGAILGWLIGAGLWASLGVFAECPQYGGGAWIFEHVPSFSCETFGKVAAFYDRHSWTALLLAAFTPLPFKVFTIAGGVFHIPLTVLIGASIIGRAARFFLVGGLIRIFGPPIRGFIERNFEWMVILFTLLFFGGFALIKQL